MISFRSTALIYPNAAAPALCDFTLDVLDGELLAVVGANGSGKSTMGRLANALLLPTSGTVTVDDVPTTGADGMAHARRTVGMVFQNPDASIVSASVEEDVAFALENQALPRERIAARVAETLDLVGLSEQREAHPLDLTASDRARLSLAGAVVGEPRYLVMDETTAYLDANDRARLLSAVQGLREATGMGVILVTHLMEEALAADRVIVLSDGELVFLGTPEELFADPMRARSWRLELPPLLQLQERLQVRGVPVGQEPLLPETALERLCRL